MTDGESKTTAPNAKAPDPADFEPEFVVGDDDASSDTSSMKPVPGTDTPPVTQDAEPVKEPVVEAGAGEKAPAVEDTKPSPVLLPLDVRKRLQKLDKLEPKYQGTHWRIYTLRNGG